MKSTLLIAATFTVFTCAFAGDTPSPKPEDINVSSVIVKAKAEAFARALVELKLKEVELRLAEPVDQPNLYVVRAQQTAINKELTNMESAPLKFRLQELESQLQEQLKTVKETNPKALDIKEEIAKCRAEIDRIEGATPAVQK